YFLGLGERDREVPRRWKKLFEKLVAERKPLMVKQRPNRQLIENEELREQFSEVRDDIPAVVHPAIDAFIEAAPGWGPGAEALNLFEWEAERVLQLFSGIKLKKTSLAQETINFFEFTFPDRLSPADNEYLRVLKGRSLKETREDDREF
ncbi:hypothetical protein, partial [Mesorhizobium sp. M1D.F.Ca.ET.183.01.1.1]|uniref:hypothetical protein n=1 Tax=Mesorhizobium sp. M1D.F.Ca.ET.183.01.1.1 TaxID=2496666 RepID=UPI00167365AE